MPPRTDHVQVKLSPDRATQLRNLAEREGVTMNTAVGKLFRALYAHTDVPHEIPSISVNALTDGLAVRFPKAKTTGFTFKVVEQMAETIREYLVGEHTGEKTVRMCTTHGGTFAIWRKGNGFKLAIPANAPEKNFTADLLEDFADILDHEVAKAKA